MLFICNVANVVNVGGTHSVGGSAFGLASLSGVLYISVIIQFLDHHIPSSISQLIKGAKQEISKSYLVF